MGLQRLAIGDFRCIEQASLSFDGQNALISGLNGAGKTSILETIYCLSRGRSFRGSRLEQLVRSGESHFTLFCELQSDSASHRLGLEAGRGHKQIRVDGENKKSLAELATLLSVEVIDPEVHGLVSEGPEVRRRFLDYGVFHVEHGFLRAWREYKRALTQRNRALKLGLNDNEIVVWDQLLVESGNLVTTSRQQYVESLQRNLSASGEVLLPGAELKCQYRTGWDSTQTLEQALFQAKNRDRELGVTSRGPHRADLILEFAGARARQRVSRGQQKLLASALVLSQCQSIYQATGRRPVLLLDDPAAELDRHSLERLLALVGAMDCQLIVTALLPDSIQVGNDAAVFHVEHGEVSSRL